MAPKHNVLSILHAQATPPVSGETGFSDLRAARASLSQPLLDRARGTKISVSVRDIGDFAKGTEEDLSKFPDAEHDIVQNHALWRSHSVFGLTSHDRQGIANGGSREGVAGYAAGALDEPVVQILPRVGCWRRDHLGQQPNLASQHALQQRWDREEGAVPNAGSLGYP